MRRQGQGREVLPHLKSGIPVASNELTSRFDRWARDYDRSVLDTARADDFPFAGYSDVLNAIAGLSQPAPDALVLDLGIGTGNLSARFADLGCQIVGVDLSEEMMAVCRRKVPSAELVRWNLTDPDIPIACRRPFDHVVSSYTLHHLPPASRTNLIARLARTSLAPRGLMVIGDISFSGVEERDQARSRWAKLWDPEEFYWVADCDAAALHEYGLNCEYTKISSCAGVYRIQRQHTAS